MFAAVRIGDPARVAPPLPIGIRIWLLVSPGCERSAAPAISPPCMDPALPLLITPVNDVVPDNVSPPVFCKSDASTAAVIRCSTRAPDENARAVVPSAPRVTVSVSPERPVQYMTSMLPLTSSTVMAATCPALGLGNSEPVVAATVRLVIEFVMLEASVVEGLFENRNMLIRVSPAGCTERLPQEPASEMSSRGTEPRRCTP